MTNGAMTNDQGMTNAKVPGRTPQRGRRLVIGAWGFLVSDYWSLVIRISATSLGAIQSLI